MPAGWLPTSVTVCPARELSTVPAVSFTENGRSDEPTPGVNWTGLEVSRMMTIWLPATSKVPVTPVEPWPKSVVPPV